jgi:integrase
MVKRLGNADLRKLKVGDNCNGAGLQVIRQPHGYQFKADKTYKGRRLRMVLGHSSEGMTIEDAYQALAMACKTPTCKQSVQVHTFPDTVAEYLKRMEATGGRNMREKRVAFAEMAGLWIKTNLADLTDYDAQVYAKLLADKGLKPQTIKHKLNCLSHLLNRAVEWGWLESATRITKPKVENRRLVYFTRQQRDALLAVAKRSASPWLYRFCLIGFYTAMRSGEILALRWGDIDFKAKVIHINKSKTGYRVCPLPKAVSQYLQPLQGNEESFLFGANSKTGHLSSKYTSRAFGLAVRQIGIDPHTYTPHIMRHSTPTHLFEAGADIITVQAVTGHKTISQLQRYSHEVKAKVQAAVDCL